MKHFLTTFLTTFPDEEETKNKQIHCTKLEFSNSNDLIMTGFGLLLLGLKFFHRQSESSLDRSSDLFSQVKHASLKVSRISQFLFLTYFAMNLLAFLTVSYDRAVCFETLNDIANFCRVMRYFKGILPDHIIFENCAANI